jgi:hypothetical protein
MVHLLSLLKLFALSMPDGRKPRSGHRILFFILYPNALKPPHRYHWTGMLG